MDYLYPEWDVWSKFTSETLQTALTMDSLRGSHAIEVEVNHALEIEQIFDAISYLKGSSCIRMLSNHLGVEMFLKVRILLALLTVGGRKLPEEAQIREHHNRRSLECIERRF